MTVEDDILMTQLHSGRTEALGVLFERYFRLVFDIAGRILRNRGEAEDVVHEVFIEICKKAGLYNPQKGSLKTWILQYAYHRSLNRKKYLSLRGFYDASIPRCPPEMQPNCEPQQLDRLYCLELRVLLQEALRGLNQREQQIIKLIVFEGMTAREASVQLQESYVNIRNHYYRGLKKLKQILERSNNSSQENCTSGMSTDEHVRVFLEQIRANVAN
jgi:RNA polymerase sigma-70 factor (ECF subfamily)